MKRKGRKPQPWWWEERKGYYATINGVRHRLADTKKAASKRLEHLAAELDGKPPEQPKPEDDPSVFALLQAFLNWTKANRSPKTHRGYCDFCDSFNERHPVLLVDELSPKYVETWLAEQAKWNSTTKRGAITCLQRAFNWGVKNHGLPKNPIAGMQKPDEQRRTTVIADADFNKLLAKVSDPEFRELLLVSFDLGCRPSEIKVLTAADFDLSKRRAVIETRRAKGKRSPRAIYIATERALKIVKKRMEDFPEGPIFRNGIGNPWTASAVKCRFEKLQIATGRDEMKRLKIKSKVTKAAIDELAKKLSQTRKTREGRIEQKQPWELRHEAKLKLIATEAKPYGIRFRHYDLRHTWITRKLVAGVDSHIVAALSGHTSSEMIDRVYSHVADDHRFMLAAAKKGA